MALFDDFPHQPSNQYFNHFNSNYDNEKLLYSLLNMEAKNLHGTCMSFIVVSFNTKYDPLFGEDNNRRIVRRFDFMGQLELPKETKSFSTMGINWTEVFHVYVSKRHFEYASCLDVNKVSAYMPYEPHEGDILNTNYNNVYYEIISVKSEEEQFQQTKHSWDLVVKVIRDKSLSYSPDTSATMTDISKYNNVSDIFDIGKFIKNTSEDISNATKIEYEPKPDECEPNDPFNNWVRN